jgi:hypothetical protein
MSALLGARFWLAPGVAQRSDLVQQAIPEWRTEHGRSDRDQQAGDLQTQTTATAMTIIHRLAQRLYEPVTRSI